MDTTKYQLTQEAWDVIDHYDWSFSDNEPAPDDEEEGDAQ